MHGGAARLIRVDLGPDCIDLISVQWGGSGRFEPPSSESLHAVLGKDIDKKELMSIISSYSMQMK